MDIMIINSILLYAGVNNENDRKTYKQFFEK